MSKKEKKSIIDKAMDYLLEMLWKLFLEVLKLLWKVFKKGCSNVITIKTILKTKYEKYIFLITIIISVIYIWMQKLHPGYYILSINYFWIKAVFQIIHTMIQGTKIIIQL